MPVSELKELCVVMYAIAYAMFCEKNTICPKTLREECLVENVVLSLFLSVAGNVNCFSYIAKMRGAKVQLLEIEKKIRFESVLSSNISLHLYSFSKYQKGKCCSIFWGAKSLHPDRCDCTLSPFQKVVLVRQRYFQKGWP